MLPTLAALIASVLITLGWLWLFVRRDRHPEPPRLLARTFAWVVSVGPSRSGTAKQRDTRSSIGPGA